MAKIVIKFKNGKMETDMIGYKGEQCTEAMKRLISDRLTENADIQEKPEYYNPNLSEEEKQELIIF